MENFYFKQPITVCCELWLAVVICSYLCENAIIEGGIVNDIRYSL